MGVWYDVSGIMQGQVMNEDHLDRWRNGARVRQRFITAVGRLKWLKTKEKEKKKKKRFGPAVITVNQLHSNINFGHQVPMQRMVEFEITLKKKKTCQSESTANSELSTQKRCGRQINGDRIALDFSLFLFSLFFDKKVYSMCFKTPPC